MNLIEKLKKLIPCSPDEAIDWDAIGSLFASICFSRMCDTPQDPVFHGEGDVMIHTRMVCEALVQKERFHTLPEREKAALFLAALLHDIGKVGTTRMDNGRWISPNHSPAGSQLVREFLWRDEQICGTNEFLCFRETVCALIRYHMLPEHLVEQKEAERRLRRIASIGERAPDFSLALLCMLAEADMEGRICEDREEKLLQVQLCRMMADEAGCLAGPYLFSDACVKHAYLTGRKVLPDQSLYDDTWGEVILLSGMPGTGKDTWIREQVPGLPVVSLDSIRKALRISPTGNQGQVVQAAKEQARDFLRKKQAFVWNATNLSADIRAKEIGLFERYGARVRIVYLETAWERRIRQNADREDAVPETTVGKMLARTVPPMPEEAQTVEWKCIT